MQAVQNWKVPPIVARAAASKRREDSVLDEPHYTAAPSWASRRTTVFECQVLVPDQPPRGAGRQIQTPSDKVVGDVAQLISTWPICQRTVPWVWVSTKVL